MGHFTKRTAEAWLRDRLDEARRGIGETETRSGAAFADAAAEWPRYIEHDRKRKRDVDFPGSTPQEPRARARSAPASTANTTPG